MSCFGAWKSFSQLRSLVFRSLFNAWTCAVLCLVGIISAIWIAAYRYSPDLRAWISKPQNGEIIVSSPTVYTRQRLVNDRLKQIAWLEEQIKAADGIAVAAGDKPEFKMIDQVAATTGSLSVAAEFARTAAGAEAGKNATDTATSSPSKSSGVREDFAVAPTTAALFRAKNSFRDDVRAEMMETQLDDRHDILGNTIYRLSFQASILAGTQQDALAGIAVRISHCPNRSNIIAARGVVACSETSVERLTTTEVLYRNDYARLYFDWLRDLQKRVSSSIDSMTKQISIDRPDLAFRLLFSRFITGRLCEKRIVGVYPGSRIDGKCDPENTASSIGEDEAREIAENAGLARWVAESYINRYLERASERQEKAFIESLDRALTKFPFIKSDLDTQESFQLRVRSSLRCQSGRDASLLLADLIPTEKKGSKELVELLEGNTLPCPFVDSATQRIQAGVSLYKQVMQLPVPQHSKAADSIYKSLEQGIDSNLFNPADARCFAADFMRAKLNAFDRTAQPHEQIDTFMKLAITGKEVGDCQLLVSPKLDPPITDLEYHLNKDTGLFSYTVTPKNLSENISTTAEVRDVYQMIAQSRLGANGEGANVLAKVLKEKSDELRAVLEHPLIVGFGSGRQPLQFVKSSSKQDQSPTVRGTELGWIIAPRIRPGGKLVQIDGQYALTAVISVPSWWRTVEIDIATCWIPRQELENYSLLTKVLFCQEGRPTWTVVQLPGAIPELSRKLGFEVVQEPYITTAALQRLKVGESGQLIFTGGRLWRSTTVTLGSQVATSITVLPNMEGIVAFFDCVGPQPSSPGLRAPGDTDTVPARVWTSEGVTEIAPVALLAGERSCPTSTKLVEKKPEDKKPADKKD